MLDEVSAAASQIAQHGGIAPTRFDRLENDAYFTIDAPWIIPALLSKVALEDPILEPAAGVGHMAVEFRRLGFSVFAMDVRSHENPLIEDIMVADMRRMTSIRGFKWIVTNLPYQDQDELGARLVALGARDGCSVALLTRAEWIVAGKRRSLVHEHPHFAGVVHLTSRPRWSEINIASPRHNFIWAIWNAAPRPRGVLPWVQFADRVGASRTSKR